MRLSVGIRDFKTKATQYFRRVREERTEFIVTMDGVPIARVVPIRYGDEQDNRRAALGAFLDEVKRVSALAEDSWLPGETAVEAVRAQRRDL